MRNLSEAYVGAIGPQGSSSPLQKLASPPQVIALTDKMTAAFDQVRALPIGDERTTLEKRLVELQVALRSLELRLLRGRK